MDYTQAVDLKRAKTRCWGIWLGHLACAPVASIVYSAKTQNWLPCLLGTGIAIVGVPLAVLDLGITAGVVAPVTSAVMLSNKVQEARRKRNIMLPEEAEAKLYNGLAV